MNNCKKMVPHRFVGSLQLFWISSGSFRFPSSGKFPRYSQLRMQSCHCLPPDSVYALRHFGLFHRGMSLLNWYNMVYMGELSCAFIRIKSTNMFYCICNLGCPGIFSEYSLRFEHRTLLFVYIQDARKCSRKYAETWIFVMFLGQWPQEKINPGFISLIPGWVSGASTRMALLTVSVLYYIVLFGKTVPLVGCDNKSLESWILLTIPGTVRTTDGWCYPKYITQAQVQ